MESNRFSRENPGGRTPHFPGGILTELEWILEVPGPSRGACRKPDNRPGGTRIRYFGFGGEIFSSAAFAAAFTWSKGSDSVIALRRGSASRIA